MNFNPSVCTNLFEDELSVVSEKAEVGPLAMATFSETSNSPPHEASSEHCSISPRNSLRFCWVVVLFQFLCHVDEKFAIGFFSVVVDVVDCTWYHCKWN